MPSTAPHTAPPANSAGTWQRPAGTVRAVPRRRRPALISLGMLLVLVCAALGGWLYLQATASTEVLVVARAVPQGQAIARADLAVVRARVPAEVKAISRSRGRLVLGQTALVSLAKGSLLTEGQFGNGEGLDTGTAVVGLALKDGQLPAAGLDPGDLVEVVRTPAGQGEGPTTGGSLVIAERARILDVQTSSDDGTALIDLVMNRDQAVVATRAQAAGEVSIILVPPR